MRRYLMDSLRLPASRECGPRAEGQLTSRGGWVRRLSRARTAVLSKNRVEGHRVPPDLEGRRPRSTHDGSNLEGRGVSLRPLHLHYGVPEGVSIERDLHAEGLLAPSIPD